MSSKQNSSQRIKTLISEQLFFKSQENSFIFRQALSDQNIRCEQILSHQKSIINQNLNKLKNLLSQNKQFAKKNRADLSPDLKYNQKSFDKFKYSTPKDHSSERSKNNLNSEKRYKISVSPKKDADKNLITDIKKKIKGSPSPTKFNSKLGQNIFAKQLIQPQTVTFFNDELVNNSKLINGLIAENQKLRNIIEDQEAQVKQLTKMIKRLQEKLGNMVNLTQEKEQNFHTMLFQKQQELRKSMLQKEVLITDFKNKMGEFSQFYYQKMEYFFKKANIKVNNLSKRLVNIQTNQLLRMQNKIKLEKLIFQSQTPYRKQKNILQKSPSIKGDRFEDFQQKRHEEEKQMFQREIEYEKNKYKQTIKAFKQNYDDLYNKFVDAQKRNQSLKVEISGLKSQQQKFIKQQEEYRKRLQEEKKNNQNQRAYFKKQLAQLKIQEDFVVVKDQTRSVKSANRTPKKVTSVVNSPKSIYLKLNYDSSDNHDRVLEKNHETLKTQSIKQKQKQLLQRQISLEQKEKQLELKQKQFDQQVKIKQQYFDELQHIKNILTTVNQSTSQYHLNGVNAQKISRQQQRMDRSSKSPSKLKEISRFEYLAKKQKKEKQIAQSRLKSLQRQLQYQKVKNNELQSLIGQKKQDLSIKIRHKVQLVENQQLQESIIEEEQLPVDLSFDSVIRQNNERFTIKENEIPLDWHNKVKHRLEDAIERLQVLENLSSSGIHKDEPLMDLKE